MRVPTVDLPLEASEWRDFVVAQSFGHLVATGPPGGLPVVAPVPFTLVGDEVLAHVPAGHELLAALREDPRCLLAVAGDVAFVPSAWKAIGAEDPALGIPTSYFAAVQLVGRAELVAEPGELAALLRRQLAAFQPDVAVADPEVAHARRLAAICGLRLAIERVEARFKYGGNVDVAHRSAVLERLAARGRPGDAAALEHLRRRVPRDAIS